LLEAFEAGGFERIQFLRRRHPKDYKRLSLLLVDDDRLSPRLTGTLCC
jgi:hypothetical protein